jgi:hypothetical protein
MLCGGAKLDLRTSRKEEGSKKEAISQELVGKSWEAEEGGHM